MSKKKILIVEDEFITATDLKFKLEEWGYEIVDIIKSGEEAVKIATEKEPDLVLMDINLKGEINGIEATKKINNPDTKVIFLTAHSDRETFDKIQDTKALGYIIKPYENKKLEKYIGDGINNIPLKHSELSKEQKIYDKYTQEEQEESSEKVKSDRSFKEEQKILKKILK